MVIQLAPRLQTEDLETTSARLYCQCALPPPPKERQLCIERGGSRGLTQTSHSDGQRSATVPIIVLATNKEGARLARRYSFGPINTSRSIVVAVDDAAMTSLLLLVPVE